jgi:hypothetical protein
MSTTSLLYDAHRAADGNLAAAGRYLLEVNTVDAHAAIHVLDVRLNKALERRPGSVETGRFTMGRSGLVEIETIECPHDRGTLETEVWMAMYPNETPHCQRCRKDMPAMRLAP